MEMLLLQGAQMHQAVMQQMMLASLPKQSPFVGPPSGQPILPPLPGPPVTMQEPMVPLSLVKELLNVRRSNFNDNI